MYSEASRTSRRIGLRLVTMILLAAGPVWAAALGTSARSVIPGEVQQIISVDYRQVNQSSVAESLRDKILPENLKQFETALRSVSIDPEKEIDQLTFVSFRDGTRLRFVGLAQGEFPLKKIFARLKARKTKATRLRGNYLYDMGSGGLRMTLLDSSTMLFGELPSLTAALAARDGELGSLQSNSTLLDLMPEVESGPIWSVLDAVVHVVGSVEYCHSQAALGPADFTLRCAGPETLTFTATSAASLREGHDPDLRPTCGDSSGRVPMARHGAAGGRPHLWP